MSMAARTLGIGNPRLEEQSMPIVTIQITREGTTREQKAALIKGATSLLSDVLNKPPALTFVIIEEVELEDWGVGGLPVLEYRRQSPIPSPT
jgi:4-oxalocrotonate tautomerase